ncbi:CW-type zinc finger domain-containing protein [Plasmodium ovale wallikeri]|uniref:CW-type zinc finger domain-containing protein n=1 Tax=Plasmodium ovale wallikeri TaxID=864142 RepID=A0A1A8YLH7_PLAOA|nr:CW-type zinc finger domain-containing protein [Plasmodium ovale wallikeri]
MVIKKITNDENENALPSENSSSKKTKVVKIPKNIREKDTIANIDEHNCNDLNNENATDNGNGENKIYEQDNFNNEEEMVKCKREENSSGYSNHSNLSSSGTGSSREIPSSSGLGVDLCIPEKDNWVQCDLCEKWRKLPSNIDMSKLPKIWYCNLNDDIKYNSCDIEEEVVTSNIDLSKHLLASSMITLVNEPCSNMQELLNSANASKDNCFGNNFQSKQTDNLRDGKKLDTLADSYIQNISFDTNNNPVERERKENTFNNYNIYGLHKDYLNYKKDSNFNAFAMQEGEQLMNKEHNNTSASDGKISAHIGIKGRIINVKKEKREEKKEKKKKNCTNNDNADDNSSSSQRNCSDRDVEISAHSSQKRKGMNEKKDRNFPKKNSKEEDKNSTSANNSVHNSTHNSSYHPNNMNDNLSQKEVQKDYNLANKASNHKAAKKKTEQLTFQRKVKNPNFMNTLLISTLSKSKRKKKKGIKNDHRMSYSDGDMHEKRRKKFIKCRTHFSDTDINVKGNGSCNAKRYKSYKKSLNYKHNENTSSSFYSYMHSIVNNILKKKINKPLNERKNEVKGKRRVEEKSNVFSADEKKKIKTEDSSSDTDTGMIIKSKEGKSYKKKKKKKKSDEENEFNSLKKKKSERKKIAIGKNDAATNAKYNRKGSTSESIPPLQSIHYEDVCKEEHAHYFNYNKNNLNRTTQSVCNSDEAVHSLLQNDMNMSGTYYDLKINQNVKKKSNDGNSSVMCKEMHNIEKSNNDDNALCRYSVSDSANVVNIANNNGCNNNNAGSISQLNNVVNWVQCENCKKWRKVDAHINITQLPDDWYCSLNFWSKYNNCDIEEEICIEENANSENSPSWDKLQGENVFSHIFPNQKREGNEQVGKHRAKDVKNDATKNTDKHSTIGKVKNNKKSRNILNNGNNKNDDTGKVREKKTNFLTRSSKKIAKGGVIPPMGNNTENNSRNIAHSLLNEYMLNEHHISCYNQNEKNELSIGNILNLPVRSTYHSAPIHYNHKNYTFYNSKENNNEATNCRNNDSAVMKHGNKSKKNENFRNDISESTSISHGNHAISHLVNMPRNSFLGKNFKNKCINITNGNVDDEQTENKSSHVLEDNNNSDALKNSKLSYYLNNAYICKMFNSLPKYSYNMEDKSINDYLMNRMNLKKKYLDPFVTHCSALYSYYDSLKRSYSCNFTAEMSTAFYHIGDVNYASDSFMQIKKYRRKLINLHREYYHGRSKLSEFLDCDFENRNCDSVHVLHKNSVDNVICSISHGNHLDTNPKCNNNEGDVDQSRIVLLGKDSEINNPVRVKDEKPNNVELSFTSGFGTHTTPIEECNMNHVNDVKRLSTSITRYRDMCFDSNMHGSIVYSGSDCDWSGHIKGNIAKEEEDNEDEDRKLCNMLINKMKRDKWKNTIINRNMFNACDMNREYVTLQFNNDCREERKNMIVNGSKVHNNYGGTVDENAYVEGNKWSTVFIDKNSERKLNENSSRVFHTRDKSKGSRRYIGKGKRSRSDSCFSRVDDIHNKAMTSCHVGPRGNCERGENNENYPIDSDVAGADTDKNCDEDIGGESGSESGDFRYISNLKRELRNGNSSFHKNSFKAAKKLLSKSIDHINMYSKEKFQELIENYYLNYNDKDEGKTEEEGSRSTGGTGRRYRNARTNDNANHAHSNRDDRNNCSSRSNRNNRNRRSKLMSPNEDVDIQESSALRKVHSSEYFNLRTDEECNDHAFRHMESIGNNNTLTSEEMNSNYMKLKNEPICNFLNNDMSKLTSEDYIKINDYLKSGIGGNKKKDRCQKYGSKKNSRSMSNNGNFILSSNDYFSNLSNGCPMDNLMTTVLPPSESIETGRENYSNSNESGRIDNRCDGRSASATANGKYNKKPIQTGSQKNLLMNNTAAANKNEMNLKKNAKSTSHSKQSGEYKHAKGRSNDKTCLRRNGLMGTVGRKAAEREKEEREKKKERNETGERGERGERGENNEYITFSMDYNESKSVIKEQIKNRSNQVHLGNGKGSCLKNFMLCNSNSVGSDEKSEGDHIKTTILNAKNLKKHILSNRVIIYSKGVSLAYSVDEINKNSIYFYNNEENNGIINGSNSNNNNNKSKKSHDDIGKDTQNDMESNNIYFNYAHNINFNEMSNNTETTKMKKVGTSVFSYDYKKIINEISFFNDSIKYQIPHLKYKFKKYINVEEEKNGCKKRESDDITNRENVSSHTQGDSNCEDNILKRDDNIKEEKKIKPKLKNCNATNFKDSSNNLSNAFKEKKSSATKKNKKEDYHNELQTNNGKVIKKSNIECKKFDSNEIENHSHPADQSESIISSSNCERNERALDTYNIDLFVNYREKNRLSEVSDVDMRVNQTFVKPSRKINNDLIDEEGKYLPANHPKTSKTSENLLLNGVNGIDSTVLSNKVAVMRKKGNSKTKKTIEKNLEKRKINKKNSEEELIQPKSGIPDESRSNAEDSKTGMINEGKCLQIDGYNEQNDKNGKNKLKKEKRQEEGEQKVADQGEDRNSSNNPFATKEEINEKDIPNEDKKKGEKKEKIVETFIKVDRKDDLFTATDLSRDSITEMLIPPKCEPMEDSSNCKNVINASFACQASEEMQKGFMFSQLGKNPESEHNLFCGSTGQIVHQETEQNGSKGKQENVDKKVDEKVDEKVGKELSTDYAELLTVSHVRGKKRKRRHVVLDSDADAEVEEEIGANLASRKAAITVSGGKKERHVEAQEERGRGYIERTKDISEHGKIKMVKEKNADDSESSQSDLREESVKKNRVRVAPSCSNSTHRKENSSEVDGSEKAINSAHMKCAERNKNSHHSNRNDSHNSVQVSIFKKGKENFTNNNDHQNSSRKLRTKSGEQMDASKEKLKHIGDTQEEMVVKGNDYSSSKRDRDNDNLFDINLHGGKETGYIKEKSSHTYGSSTDKNKRKYSEANSTDSCDGKEKGGGGYHAYEHSREEIIRREHYKMEIDKEKYIPDKSAHSHKGINDAHKLHEKIYSKSYSKEENCKGKIELDDTYTTRKSSEDKQVRASHQVGDNVKVNGTNDNNKNDDRRHSINRKADYHDRSRSLSSFYNDHHAYFGQRDYEKSYRNGDMNEHHSSAAKRNYVSTYGYKGKRGEGKEEKDKEKDERGEFTLRDHSRKHKRYDYKDGKNEYVKRHYNNSSHDDIINKMHFRGDHTVSDEGKSAIDDIISNRSANEDGKYENIINRYKDEDRHKDMFRTRYEKMNSWNKDHRDNHDRRGKCEKFDSRYNNKHELKYDRDEHRYDKYGKYEQRSSKGENKYDRYENSRYSNYVNNRYDRHDASRYVWREQGRFDSREHTRNESNRFDNREHDRHELNRFDRYERNIYERHEYNRHNRHEQNKTDWYENKYENKYQRRYDNRYPSKHDRYGSKYEGRRNQNSSINNHNDHGEYRKERNSKESLVSRKCSVNGNTAERPEGTKNCIKEENASCNNGNYERKRINNNNDDNCSDHPTNSIAHSDDGKNNRDEDRGGGKSSNHYGRNGIDNNSTVEFDAHSLGNNNKYEKESFGRNLDKRNRYHCRESNYHMHRNLDYYDEEYRYKKGKHSDHHYEEERKKRFTDYGNYNKKNGNAVTCANRKLINKNYKNYYANKMSQNREDVPMNNNMRNESFTNMNSYKYAGNMHIKKKSP